MNPTLCKNCGKTTVTKNGKVRNKQRYKCKSCGYNFVLGDNRTNDKVVALKAMVVLLYSLAKGSYNMLGTIFGRDRSLIYRWIKEAGLSFDDPPVEGEIKEIEFDEMWHFVTSKKTNFGSLKPLIAARGKLSHGFSVVVILQHSNGFTTK
jgi:transposase-like protein